MLFGKKDVAPCCIKILHELSRKVDTLMEERKNLRLEEILLNRGWTAEKVTYKRFAGSLWKGGAERTAWEDAYMWKWYPPKGTKGLKQETFTLKEAVAIDKHLKH